MLVIPNQYLLSTHHSICLQPLYLQKSLQVFIQNKTCLLPILPRKSLYQKERQWSTYLLFMSLSTSITVPTDHALKLKRTHIPPPLTSCTSSTIPRVSLVHHQNIPAKRWAHYCMAAAAMVTGSHSCCLYHPITWISQPLLTTIFNTWSTL